MSCLLGLPPGPGLVDVLTGAATLDEALVEIPEYHLTVLRAGRYLRPAGRNARIGADAAARRHAAHPVRSDRHRLGARHRDRPRRRCTRWSTRLLLVVRAGSTTKPAIARAISRSERPSSSDSCSTRAAAPSRASMSRAPEALCSRSPPAAVMGPGHAHAVVQTVGVGARTDRVRLRDSPDRRIACWSPHVSTVQPMTRGSLEDRASHRALPRLPLLQRLLRPDDRPVGTGSRHSPLPGRWRRIDPPGAHLLRAAGRRRSRPRVLSVAVSVPRNDSHLAVRVQPC